MTESWSGLNRGGSVCLVIDMCDDDRVTGLILGVLCKGRNRAEWQINTCINRAAPDRRLDVEPIRNVRCEVTLYSIGMAITTGNQTRPPQRLGSRIQAGRSSARRGGESHPTPFHQLL